MGRPKHQQAWMKWTGGPSNYRRKKPKPAACGYCGILSIPKAVHPKKATLKFCSWEHGNLYIREGGSL